MHELTTRPLAVLAFFTVKPSFHNIHGCILAKIMNVFLFFGQNISNNENIGPLWAFVQVFCHKIARKKITADGQGGPWPDAPPSLRHWLLLLHYPHIVYIIVQQKAYSSITQFAAVYLFHLLHSWKGNTGKGVSVTSFPFPVMFRYFRLFPAMDESYPYFQNG